MKKNEVQIGQTYTAKITDKVVPVRIDSEHHLGGWTATNLKTNRQVRIKTAQRLRGQIKAEDADSGTKPAASKEAAKTPQAATSALKTDEVANEPNPGPKATTGKTEGSQSKRLSLLDAAAVVLEVLSPLSCKDIVEKAIETNIWQPKSGKTPANTLYASILREINTKGDDSRFRRAQERGKFELVN